MSSSPRNLADYRRQDDNPRLVKHWMNIRSILQEDCNEFGQAVISKYSKTVLPSNCSWIVEPGVMAHAVSRLRTGAAVIFKRVDTLLVSERKSDFRWTNAMIELGRWDNEKHELLLAYVEPRHDAMEDIYGDLCELCIDFLNKVSASVQKQ